MKFSTQPAGLYAGTTNQFANVSPSNEQRLPVGSDNAVSRMNDRWRHSLFRRSLLGTAEYQHAAFEGEMDSSLSREKYSRALSPSRTASSSNATRHRKGAESLTSLRLSIFGSRKRRQRSSSTRSPTAECASPPTLKPRMEHYESRVYSKDDFPSEQEYYRHLKKQSISPPFNFQHITHTVHKQLPSLQDVDEKDLSARFWAVSAYQTPRRHLNGIRADDIPQSWSPLNSRPSSIARPKSLNAAGYSRAELWNDLASLQRCASPIIGKREGLLVHPSQRQPQSSSSRHAPAPSSHPDPQTSFGSLDQKQPSTIAGDNQSITPLNQIPLQQSGQTVRDPSKKLTRISEGTSETIGAETDRNSWLWLSTQFPQPPNHRRADSLVAFPDPRRDHLCEDEPTRLKALASRSESALNGPTLSGEDKRRRALGQAASVVGGPSDTDSRAPASRRKASWEDDVDFAYSQMLESTSDFDWADNLLAVRKKFLANAHDNSQESLVPCSSINTDLEGSLHPASQAASQSSVRSRQQVAHRARPLVGYRGFVEARKGSCEQLPDYPASTPPKVRVVSDEPDERLLSPMSSMASIRDRVFKTHSSNASKNSYSECLSDPESILTGSSGNRKSSSCSSCESFRQLTSAANSTPDLLTSSKMKSRAPGEVRQLGFQAQVQKLEQATIDNFEPSSPKTRLNLDETAPMMRRPETPGERAVLRAAGVAAKKQQRRPITPSNVTGSQKASRLLNGPSNGRLVSEQPVWI